MNRENVKRDFFSILREAEPMLASHIDVIRERGLEDWVHLLVPELGSHAGYPHLRNVERIANRIVPDHLKDDFSPGEIFLLLSAIFLHDIGKTMPSPKEPHTWCNQDVKDCTIRAENNPPPCYKSQWDHFELGERFIRAQGITLGLPDERIAQYCGLLVFCHGLRVPPIKEQPYFADEANKKKCSKTWPERDDYRTTSLSPYGVMRIPLLATILRIADETDDSWARALRGYWFSLQRQNQANVGKAFRRCIEDIEFSHDGQCLILHIPEMDEMSDTGELRRAYIESINKVRWDITMVLKQWGQELAKIGVHFDEVYIEYGNHLYRNFHLDTKRPPLCEVLSDKNKKSVEKMLNAMIRLSLGSCEYPLFTWEVLEAEVGQPLTVVDKWLAGRIADASDNHILMTEQDEFHVDLTRDNVAQVKELILL